MVTWDRPSRIGQTFLSCLMALLAIVMIFPFVYVVAVSLSNNQDVLSGGLVIWPAHPNLDAYRWVLLGGGVVQGLEVSFFIAIVGTAVSMTITVTMAYALSRRGVPGNKGMLWIVLLCLLITPGIITKYLVVRQLGMLDTLWALIIPNAVNPFNVIVMRQFFMTIPDELIDCARLDGATHVQVLWRVVLPLSKAALAAISLFYAVAGWNSFFEPAIYINNPSLYPLSIILRQIVLQGGLTADELPPGQTLPPPDLTIQMAVVVIAIVPILLIYPLLQKYFTKGVLTGSIKG